MTSGRCADLSEAAGESLAATATTVHNWLLVEVRGTWPRDVSDMTLLHERARDTITAWLEGVPSSRLLFIRRPGRRRDRRLVFVVRATEEEADVRRLELGETEDLAGIDLAVDGDAAEVQLVLVCGHGTRDPCCALRGSAVYGALATHVAPEELWLSSHHGGHRFAANVLLLPDGVHLGRVTPEAAPRVVGAALAGRIVLEHYRGRTAYSSREQAAERVVREARELVSLSDIRLAGDDGMHVRFVDTGAREYRAVAEETTGPMVPASCGVAATPQQHVTARLV
jgi:hypothetical protein